MIRNEIKKRTNDAIILLEAAAIAKEKGYGDDGVKMHECAAKIIAPIRNRRTRGILHKQEANLGSNRFVSVEDGRLV